MAGRKRGPRPILIGLTGGPGVGKSEIAKLLARRGAEVIHADRIGHEVLDQDDQVQRRVVNLLGTAVIGNSGRPDRQRIRAIVFQDLEKMAGYNRIVHPPLLRKLKEQLRRFEQSRRLRMVVVDAALIFEWGIADWFDIVVVADAPRQTRLRRLRQSGISHRDAIRRIALQIPQREKAQLADYVMHNNSTKRQLAREVERFLGSLRLPLELEVVN